MVRTSPNSVWAVHLTALAILLTLLLAGYWNGVVLLAKLWWTSGTYGHGLLVAPISAWLIWRQRHALAVMAPRSSLLGVMAVAALSVVWLLASAVYVEAANQVVVVALVPMLVWAVLGGHVLRAVWFPMAFLFFAVPIWGVMVPLLQDLTAYTVYRFLGVLGVPVVLDGHFLIIPSGTFLVEEVCAGLRYFIAGVTVSALFAYLMFSQTRKRVVFFALAAALTIVANWLRVLVVVMAGHLTEMQHPFVHDHIALGWVLFGLLVFPLFLLAGRYRDHATAATAQPSLVIWPARPVVLVLAVACLLMGPVAVVWMERANDMVDFETALNAPGAAEGWAGPISQRNGWAPVFGGAQASVQREYRRGDVVLSFYTARYGRQRQGAELINKMNRVYDGAHWRPAPYREVSIVELGALWPNRMIETPIVSVLGNRRLVWHWYVVGGSAVVEPLSAKVLEVISLLQGRSQSSVVVLAVEYQDDIQSARQALTDFVETMGPSLK